jgi:hypothetical protein
LIQWRQAGGDGTQIVALGETAQRDLERLVSVIIGRAEPSRHADHATPHAAGVVLAIASGDCREERHFPDARWAVASRVNSGIE